MTRKEREKIKDFIYNVLMVFQHQEEFLADDSGLGNFENPMFDKARSYILKRGGALNDTEKTLRNV